jgi:ATP dependent DNA ligase-like protein
MEWTGIGSEIPSHRPGRFQTEIPLEHPGRRSGCREEKGIPRFQLLQRFQKQATAPTLYYFFDVLWHDGNELTGKPILERRSMIERILKPAAGIQLASRQCH